MLTSENLLFAFNEADDALLERVRKTLGYRVGEKKKARSRKLWKTLLVAAVLLSLLAGAAFAARLVGVGNLRAGELFGVKMLSMEGLSDSPEGQALREWLAYYEQHRGDAIDAETAFALQKEYGAYGAATEEMAAKIDEICEKYSLTRLGRLSTPADERSFWEAAGVGKLTAGSGRFENDYAGGYVYESGTFQFDGELFPRQDSYRIPYQFRRAAKGVLGYVTINAGDPNDYTEWRYTTADGHSLTIADAERGAFFLLERPESFVVVSIGKAGWLDAFNDGILDGLGDKLVSLDLKRKDLEAIAEAFNWMALDDPTAGMDGEFSYHQYAEESAAQQLSSPELDLSMIPARQASLKPIISAVYEQQIAPFIRDFRLVDYSIEHGRANIGWISFTGTPTRPLDWQRVETPEGLLFCRSVTVTTGDDGLPLALPAFDMLPIPKLSLSTNIGTEEEPDYIWHGTEHKTLASASLYVQQTGETYTLEDPAKLTELALMLRADEVASMDTQDLRFNPLYLRYTDGTSGLAFTAASGANAFCQYGSWQGYQYGRTLFEVFGVPLAAKGYTRDNGILSSHLDDDTLYALASYTEVDWAEGGDPIERRVMSDMLRPARYAYDENHNRVGETWWEGETMTRETVSTYDAEGRILHSETRIGNNWFEADYHYDAQGRLTEELHRDSDDLPGAIGGNVYYAYDEEGNCRRTLGWQLLEEQ